MDRWKYFGITHRDHVLCNPTSTAKIDELIEILALAPGARVVDFACGKAEMLMRICERWDASGVGIDLSPYEVPAARANVAARGLDGRIEIFEGEGAEHPVAPGSVDLAMCIGATWIWDGYEGTLAALGDMVVPGGLVAVGEPFMTREPDPEHLAADPEIRGYRKSHADNFEIARRAGLTPLYAVVSNVDDWDRYEGLQVNAAERYAAEHPDDADNEALLARCRGAFDAYVRWGRDTFNWAIYLLRKPG